MDRAEGEHDLGRRSDRVQAAIVNHFDTVGPVALEEDPRHERVRDHREVGFVQIRGDVGAEHRETLTVTPAQVSDGGAAVLLHHAAVGTLVGRNPDRPRRIDCRHGQRVHVRRGLHEDRSPAAAVIRLADSMPILDRPIQIKHRPISPRTLAGLSSEVLPVASMSPRPDHQVDARSPAQHFAHRKRDRSAVHRRVGLGREIPITLAAKVHRPLGRLGDGGYLIGAAGLQEQDPDVGILGDPSRDHRPRRPGPTHDDVVGGP